MQTGVYPHLFAHELAEELTTQNLLEDGAVFPQIFATTNAALMRHLNDRFSEYQLGRDEDFEHRRILSAVLRVAKTRKVSGYRQFPSFRNGGAEAGHTRG